MSLCLAFEAMFPLGVLTILGSHCGISIFIEDTPNLNAIDSSNRLFVASQGTAADR